MKWFEFGWGCIDGYVRQHQLFVAAVLAHNISEMMTRLERQVTICKHLHASASQEFHCTLHDFLSALDETHDRLYNCCRLFNKTLELPMNDCYVNIANMLFTCYSLFMLAASGDSVYCSASRVRLSLARLYNVLCEQSQDVTDDGALMARNVLRAMKGRRPRLTVGDFFELRMGLVTGFEKHPQSSREIENRKTSLTNIEHDDTIIHHECTPQSPSEIVQLPAKLGKKSSQTSKKSEHVRRLAKAIEEVAKLKLEVALAQLKWTEAEEINRDSSSSSEIEHQQTRRKLYIK
ncbi:hypothetical protein EVAR_62408_1 [Eumeta japonica]|uniref:Uncharacterized protein n=1 Tax=Eumeta variegata TaxID=151549 RepID=A0A4C1Z5U2_EUMVA|nr:hypothetical protein EVAR_62408_1 [Eumeta japonica]